MTISADKTYAMTARNTFTSICFRSGDRGVNRNEMLDVVFVDGGKVVSNKSFCLILHGGRHGKGVAYSFPDVFNEIRDKVANRNIPVIGWGLEPGKRLSSLIETYDIDIECPIRYFDLQISARRKIGEASSQKWQTVAAKLNVETNGRRQPSAVDCAAIHLALEKIDYRLVVARAFLTFIKSIMYDPDTPDAIDKAEAKGLQAFLSVLTDDFKQFKSLKNLVDKALEDDVIEDYESRDLMEELKKMESEYQNFIDSRG